MKLTGPTGSFELTVLDYECADSRCFLQRNGLLVQLATQHQNQEYKQAAPVLSTWELELLRDWIRSLVTHSQLAERVTFLEPAISFSALSSAAGYELRLKLSHEARPDWQPDAREPFYLTLSPDTQQLQTAISDLDNWLEKFPVRN